MMVGSIPASTRRASTAVRSVQYALPGRQTFRSSRRPAAAEAAGFRPCLRCRPETAPFCSAWIGSRATVERALRLIVEEGALDQEGATVERLAQRLGVGSRQLTRLFARYLQASPSKVARTARVQRAKRLLDETSLPMTEIAMRAGFGSLRRFNSVFVEVYGRPPTEFAARGDQPVRRNKRSRMPPTTIGSPCSAACCVHRRPSCKPEGGCCEWPESACAVKRRRFPVGARPTRQFAPAGSNRSSHGGNEMAEAFE